MLSLKTEGFADLVSDVVARARLTSEAAKVVRIALTLDDRLDEEVGAAALTHADRAVIDLVRGSATRIEPDTDAEDRLLLTRTGRLIVAPDGAAAPPDAHLLGALRWTDLDPAELRALWRDRHTETQQRIRAVRDDLVREPLDRIVERVDRIEDAVLHMAPVLIYVDDRVYTTLGKISNLPGKSLSPTDQRCLLMQLRGKPVAEWAPADACFVACLNALLLSGPPVRAEEFNGVQLDPDTLALFLTEHIARYAELLGTAPPPATVASGLTDLDEAATACNRLRAKAVAGTVVPYRVINGLNLHKREHLMAAPMLLADVPAQLRSCVTDLLDTAPAVSTPIEHLAPLWADLAGRLAGAPTPVGFGTAFEAALHTYLTAAAESFDADVSMSRGPQRFDPLRAEPKTEDDPLTLRTGDFYCCVTPRRAFVERFGAGRPELVRTLAAYSARMRFNTWHYLPHTLGIVEREPGREDWFFAPVMPDVTEWSDQHHTGHVTFGVRYAIRVPFGIDYEGRCLPGLYDLRLMRTSPPPFTTDDLRQAIAAGELLRGFYQAMSAHQPVVTDFGKDWYRQFHG